MRRSRTLELLAPAGNRTCLQAALDHGCDAVYFGVRGYNMRAAADNFTVDQLSEVADACHERGAKAYLALNTIQYQDELDGMRDTIGEAASAGIDAVICWDHAVLDACKAAGIDPHISTQASVANVAGILHYHKAYGVTRIVLARECTMDHVKQIREDLRKELGDAGDEIELEAFAHGAMCVSVSGRCFLSEHAFGRSGNRGDCLQPCRREFRVTDVDGETEYVMGRDYLLSPKDLCTLPFIDQLIEAGISSFKIEGRNRNPEYVAIVTESYRAVLDFCLERMGTPSFHADLNAKVDQVMPRLESVYNRGFSKGFYMGRPIGEWAKADGSEATMTKAFCGTVVNYYGKVGVAEINVQDQAFSIGDNLLIQGPTTGNLEQKVESIQIEHDSVDRAPKGARVALKVARRVRTNDKVYVRRARQG